MAPPPRRARFALQCLQQGGNDVRIFVGRPKRKISNDDNSETML